MSTEPDSPAQWDLLRQAFIFFSVASLGTLEFFRNSWYRADGVEVSQSAVVYAIIIVQVVPALLLLAVDRLIAGRYGTGRILTWYRTAVFSVGLLLIARQLQLYWGSAEEVTQWLRSASPVLLVAAGLGLVGAIVALCFIQQRGVTLFFWYMSPIAIAMAAILPFHPPQRAISPPEALAEEVQTADVDGSAPPVFIFVLDEAAYDLFLTEEGGELDRETFPNFARLADEGTWFTNATSNHYWTAHSVPNILNPVTQMTDDFNLRLYMQFAAVEDTYIEDCGTRYTCRGSRYLAQERPGWLGADLSLRALYEAVPESVEPVLDVPVEPVLKLLDAAHPKVNELGYQTHTKKQFDLFLDDIDADTSPGTIYFVHSMATHWPYAFNENGDPRLSDRPKNRYINFERSREAVRFADKLMGRFIERLEDEGLFDEAVVMITADHGLRTYYPSAEKPPAQFEVQVPLLVKAPGHSPPVSDVDYQHIDFGPTLADVLNLPPPDGSDGVSAFAENRPDRVKEFKANRDAYVQDEEDGTWRPKE